MLLHDYPSADTCFKEVLKLESGNKAAMAQHNLCLKRIKEEQAKEKKMYRNIFAKLSAMNERWVWSVNVCAVVSVSVAIPVNQRRNQRRRKWRLRRRRKTSLLRRWMPRQQQWMLSFYHTHTLLTDVSCCCCLLETLLFVHCCLITVLFQAISISVHKIVRYE